MSKEDREALVVYVLFLLFLLGLFVLLVVSTRTPVPETTKFSVVDTYKGCSVVRFIPPGDAKSHYFLDCSSK